MPFDSSQKLKSHQTSVSFSVGVYLYDGSTVLAYFVPLLAWGSSFVTVEIVVQINIWRHVEHEEWHCSRSGGQLRVMPLTGNIWVVNSRGECISARGIYSGGWVQNGSRGSCVLLCFEGKKSLEEVWSYGVMRMVTGDSRWPSHHAACP